MSSSTVSTVCRAKDPSTCAYHNPGAATTFKERELATRMEVAANDLDLDAYHEYRLQLDALHGKVNILSDFGSSSDLETDDDNLEEHNLYTQVRDKVSWGKFAMLGRDEQKRVVELVEMNPRVQLSVAEDGSENDRSLLARAGGEWVTYMAWGKLAESSEWPVLNAISMNNEAPQDVRNGMIEKLQEFS